MLDEAAAVLVGYRVGLSEERKERGLLGTPEEGDAGEEEKRDKRAVVLDIGETSLGISVIAVAEGEFTVLGKGRDDKLGGREFDNLVGDRNSIRRPPATCGLMDRPKPTCSSSSISRKSSRRRQKSRWIFHVERALPTATSALKPNSASRWNTPSAPFPLPPVLRHVLWYVRPFLSSFLA